MSFFAFSRFSDLAASMSSLSSRVPPNFHVGSRLISMRAVIRVYDADDSVTETHEHKGDLQRAMNGLAILPPLNGHFPLWRQKWIARYRLILVTCCGLRHALL